MAKNFFDRERSQPPSPNGGNSSVGFAHPYPPIVFRTDKCPYDTLKLLEYSPVGSGFRQKLIAKMSKKGVTL